MSQDSAPAANAVSEAAALQALLAPRYAIHSELGRGGTSTVYPADDRKHPRRIAIEVLRWDVAPARGADRFLVEALTYAALGMSEVGIQRLDSIFAERSPLTITPFQLRVSPDFDGLRRDPAFARLLSEYERRVER